MTKPTTAELLRDLLCAVAGNPVYGTLTWSAMVDIAKNGVAEYERGLAELKTELGETAPSAEPPKHATAIQHLAEDALRSRQPELSIKVGDILVSYPTAPGNHVVKIRSSTPVWVTTHPTLEAAELHKRWVTAWSHIQAYLDWGEFDTRADKLFEELNRVGLCRLSEALRHAMQAAKKPNDR